MKRPTSSPFVSVIIVHYNGIHFLPSCLNALHAQTYPKDRFEVILSDNGSTDGSVDFLREQYSWVHILENGGNLGFASGNNAAIQIAKGEYVILLNNDTAPDPTWLEKLVAVAEDMPQAGMVTSKLLLFYDQLALNLTTDPFIPPNDARELGIQVYDVNTGLEWGVVQYLEGFHGWEQSSNGQMFRWTKPKAILGIPVPPGENDWSLSLKLAAPRPHRKNVPVTITLEGEVLARLSVVGEDPVNHLITLPSSARSELKPLIQNAGSVIFRDGSGRDRGTYVRSYEAFFERDKGQYDKTEEVFAGCGAGLLLRKTALEETGLFDDKFFMYYEDTDLAWRMRLLGWKVVYAPQAVVRHIHCGSSGEWSPFFTFHVHRNRLAMLAKNGHIRQVIRTWGSYFFDAFLNSLQLIFTVIRRRGYQRTLAHHTRMQYRVILNLIRWLPDLWRKRSWIQSASVISKKELERWFLDE